MCFQISPSTINTSTITSMLIPGITRDQILNGKVVCDLTLGMNCYSICCNTCFERNFPLSKPNNYSQLHAGYCERGAEIQPQYFLSVQICLQNNTDIICTDFRERGLLNCKASWATLLQYCKFIDLLVIIKSHISKHQMRHLHDLVW